MTHHKKWNYPVRVCQRYNFTLAYIELQYLDGIRDETASSVSYELDVQAYIILADDSLVMKISILRLQALTLPTHSVWSLYSMHGTKLAQFHLEKQEMKWNESRHYWGEAVTRKSLLTHKLKKWS